MSFAENRLKWMAAIAVGMLSSLTSHADELRLNEIQVIGSHNSYHRAPPAEVLSIIGSFQRDAVEAWNYTQPLLTEQAAAGLRQFELDVYADPKGGLFSNPMTMNLGMLSGKKLAPFDPDGELKKPGFKILHVPDIDCWTNNRTLESALGELSAWSLANPHHLPVMILIECEDEAHPPLPTKPMPFVRERLLEMEQEILKVIPSDRILRPDDVRRGEPTLPAALQLHGWPALASVRGKFIICLDNTSAIRDRYLEGNPALENRLIFVSAPDVKHPAAAWFKCNDPVGEFEKIQQLVKGGFLVRTRADDRKADAAMRDRAFASGAQWISTDHFGTNEPAESRVAFADGKMIRSNPVSGNKDAVIAP